MKSTGKDLFRLLLERSESGQYDDEFLELLIQYRSYVPDSEKFEIFYGHYALAHGNLQVALEEALKAEKKRPLNLEVWKLLSTIHHAVGNHDMALIYDGFCSHLYKIPVRFNVSRGDLEHSLEILSRAMSLGDYAPFLTSRCTFQDGRLEEKRGVYGGGISRTSSARARIAIGWERIPNRSRSTTRGYCWTTTSMTRNLFGHAARDISSTS